MIQLVGKCLNQLKDKQGETFFHFLIEVISFNFFFFFVVFLVTAHFVLKMLVQLSDLQSMIVYEHVKR